MGVNAAYEGFMKKHIESRTGERRRRLVGVDRHAEELFAKTVWYPLRGDFDHLHPEYEVPDWRKRSYFADYAWRMKWVTVLIEIKGFGIHVTDMDRDKYSRELNRETYLVAMGYNVVSFSYDDVRKHPEVCINLLRMVLSRFESGHAPVSRAQLAEKELLRLAIRMVKPLRPIDVQAYFDIDYRTAVAMMRSLTQKGWFKPVFDVTGKKVIRYELVHHAANFMD